MKIMKFNKQSESIEEDEYQVVMTCKGEFPKEIIMID